MLTPFDLLDHYYTDAAYMRDARGHADLVRLRGRRQQLAAAFCEPSLQPFFDAMQRLPVGRGPLGWEVRGGQVVVAPQAPADISAALPSVLRVFQPWKKGPFTVAGCAIDAEWRSDLKWERLAGHYTPLRDRRVLDIGCHNGYFMWRMAAEKPRHVIGFEPVARHALLFHLLNGLAGTTDLAFELLGVEDCDLFDAYFDTVFCLGILYHHTDPVGLLRRIRQAMARGGELLVDVQGIPGDEPLCLVPATRYAGSKGTWFLPSVRAVQHWLARAGFREIRVVYSAPLASEEQRTTAWAAMPSLADHLDPNDSARTCEGYPAPWRHYLVAVK